MSKVHRQHSTAHTLRARQQPSILPAHPSPRCDPEARKALVRATVKFASLAAARAAGDGGDWPGLREAAYARLVELLVKQSAIVIQLAAAERGRGSLAACEVRESDDAVRSVPCSRGARWKHTV